DEVEALARGGIERLLAVAHDSHGAAQPLEELLCDLLIDRIVLDDEHAPTVWLRRWTGGHQRAECDKRVGARAPLLRVVREHASDAVGELTRSDGFGEVGCEAHRSEARVIALEV